MCWLTKEVRGGGCADVGSQTPVMSPVLLLLPTQLQGSRVKQVPNRAMDPEMGPKRRAESTRNVALREVRDGQARVSQQARQQLARQCTAGGAPGAPSCAGWGGGVADQGSREAAEWTCHHGTGPARAGAQCT